MSNSRNNVSVYTFDCHREVQREVFQISIVVLQENEAVIQIRVERGEIVQERLFAEPLWYYILTHLASEVSGETHLRQKEPSKPHVYQYALVHRFPQNTTDETIPVQAMG